MAVARRWLRAIRMRVQTGHGALRRRGALDEHCICGRCGKAPRDHGRAGQPCVRDRAALRRQCGPVHRRRHHGCVRSARRARGPRFSGLSGRLGDPKGSPGIGRRHRSTGRCRAATADRSEFRGQRCKAKAREELLNRPLPAALASTITPDSNMPGSRRTPASCALIYHDGGDRQRGFKVLAELRDMCAKQRYALNAVP